LADQYQPWAWKVPESSAPLKQQMTRQDGYERVSGNAVYTRDIYLPGMRYAKILTSPYAHAKIKSMDTAQAESLLGVRDIVRFDDPLNPTIFDKLVEVTGAQSVPWQARLECCGAPLFGVNDELSMDLTEKKLLSAQESGANLLCTACPYCQIQFDTVQRMISKERKGENHLLAPILYTQLLGLSLGIEGKVLGIHMNGIDVGGVGGF